MTAFAEQLAKLGYEVTALAHDGVSFQFRIETGPRTGEVITLGFVVPGDFPLTPPSGPHVRPRLLPINTTAGTHPTNGVHESPLFGSEWQYWSRPIPHWNTTRRNAADYMAHIHHLFATL